VVPATRKSAFFATSSFRQLRATTPLNLSLIDVAKVGEIVSKIMASQLPIQPVLKLSVRKYAATTPALPSIATISCSSRLPDSTTAGKKNVEAPL
jgi:hypothetical protein